MNKYKLLYLFWLLPGYLLFLSGHQALVFYSIVDTYENGQSYYADVVEYDLKQIAAQTNGYVILEFEKDNNQTYRKKLSLPVELAGPVGKANIIPIRYREGAFVNIVMIPTYSTQKGLVLTNLAMAFVGFLLAFFAAGLVHRYVRKKTTGKDEKLVIERVDNEQ